MIFHKPGLKTKSPQNLSLQFMQFEDIIGQAQVKNKLVELVMHNRLSHALLFIGKEGSGVLPLSLAFVQYVVCETVNGKAQHIIGPSLFGEELATKLGHRMERVYQTLPLWQCLLLAAVHRCGKQTG